MTGRYQKPEKMPEAGCTTETQRAQWVYKDRHQRKEISGLPGHTLKTSVPSPHPVRSFTSLKRQGCVIKGIRLLERILLLTPAPCCSPHIVNISEDRSNQSNQCALHVAGRTIARSDFPEARHPSYTHPCRSTSMPGEPQ